jgi:phosphoribosylglycinamide formyltransferase-1
MWDKKILNVHPSLLPKYAGGMNNNVHESVLKNEDKETGCTIHLVTTQVDQGPIVVQKKCDVFKNDTVESLKNRVQRLEGEAFIESIKSWGKK